MDRKAVTAIFGLGAVAGGLWLLTRKAEAKEFCCPYDSAHGCFRTLGQLNAHIESVHPGEPPVLPTCFWLWADLRYHFYYYGTRKLLPEALGDCWGWDVIYYFEYWDYDLNDWVQPADPTNYWLEPGTRCAIMVQRPCELCGFVYVGIG